MEIAALQGKYALIVVVAILIRHAMEIAVSRDNYVHIWVAVIPRSVSFNKY